MFTLDTTPLPDRAGLRLELRRAGAPVSVRATVDLWQRAPSFAAWFNGALGALPFTAFRWETPAVTADTADQPFVCVVLDNPSLARAPDPEAFAAHFARAPDAPVVEFSNISGDVTDQPPRRATSTPATSPPPRPPARDATPGSPPRCRPLA